MGIDDASAAVSSLPPLYARWISEVLPGRLPEERHATCHDCAMCKPPREAATGHEALFNPSVKCCSYLPMLWNFLTGAVLKDAGPRYVAGRDTVELRIMKDDQATSLGLHQPLEYSLIYRYLGGDLFGSSAAILCPHYLDGVCGVWDHRNSVCATYFCKHERGALGKAFWNAVLALLQVVERQLSIWCALELGEDIASVSQALLLYDGLGPPKTGGHSTAVARTPIPTHYQWSARWRERRREFYIEAARVVEFMPWTQVAEVCGPEVPLRTKLLRDAYTNLQLTVVPNYLRLTGAAISDPDDDYVFVSGYGPQDILPLPSPLLEALSRFDGHCRTLDVCERIATETGLNVDLSTLQRLVAFNVLTPMPSPIPITISGSRQLPRVAASSPGGGSCVNAVST